MKIALLLSPKADTNGLAQIILRANKKVNEKVVTMRANSEVYTLPDFFDKTDGINLNKKRAVAPDVRKYHVEQQEKLNGLLSAIAKAELEADANTMDSTWLRVAVDKNLHPDKYMTTNEREANKTFYDLAEDYLKQKAFSIDYTKGVRVMVRAVARYEGFVRATDNRRTNFTWNIHTIDRNVIEDFADYLRAERKLFEEYPTLFAKLISNYPANVKRGYNVIEGRGENATMKLLKKLRGFCHWLEVTKRTTNRPFEGVKIGSEKYGTPYYITIEERDQIAATPMPTKHLETQRDIFIFQCFIGCRVGDLVKLTDENIQGDILSYTPHMTRNEGTQSRVATIPLHPTAQALIEKYRGVDKQGRLFPFISSQKYNDAIKEIFSRAGIVRVVQTRNALTGENEMRPINEVASSHLARRTFVGNAYKVVQDPNLIGKMSGHVEGSKAFARYRNIENDTLRSVIDKMGGTPTTTATEKPDTTTTLQDLTKQLATLSQEQLAALQATLNNLTNNN